MTNSGPSPSSRQCRVALGSRLYVCTGWSVNDGYACTIYACLSLSLQLQAPVHICAARVGVSARGVAGESERQKGCELYYWQRHPGCILADCRGSATGWTTRSSSSRRDKCHGWRWVPKETARPPNRPLAVYTTRAPVAMTQSAD